MASSSTDISTERSRWHDVIPLLAALMGVVVVVVSAVDAVVASVMPQLIVVDNVVGGEQSGILSMMLVERHSSRRRMSDDQASSIGVDRVGAWNFAPCLVVGSIPLLLSYLNFMLSSVCERSNNNDDDDDDDGGEDRRPMTIFVRDIMICGSGINK